MEELIFGGAHLRKEICVSICISICVDWASLTVGRNLPFLPCFTLYLRAISKYKPPGERGGLYLEGQFNGGFFCVTSLGGLHLDGLTHGGAYFQNFMVFHLYGVSLVFLTILHNVSNVSPSIL